MAVFILDERPLFPPVELAEPDGLLAMGGDLTALRLVTAYRQGIFPWYEGETILWWSPDPRCVLFPEKLKVSKSMKTLLRGNKFRFTTNTAFEQVITACGCTPRNGQAGTWITPEMEAAYNQLHAMGIAHSAETWLNGRLVGGLYGLRFGHFFCGESMFSHENNASKFAFIHYVRQLAATGVRLIDCQMHTTHLESLGAEMIPREEFIRRISEPGFSG